ncbi:right-handed parallel beta-helix repeat-containing protein [Daejeonella sp.]|uniref:right-handed parallel beta-helix repeat-containing protein n=1 Tax=Daejeonella sp. TaxID=2805397 RepID=UPI0030C30595
MSKFRYRISFLILICTGVCASSFAQEKVLLAADFISEKDSDVVPGVLKLLKEAKDRKVSKIIFQPGTYHFYDDHAFEKYAFISNHDSGPRRMAFPIIDFHGLEIDGGGAKFIMHGLIIPFAIENSSDITIRNLSVNWFRPTHSELVVAGVSSDASDPYIDFGITDQYPYEIKNGELIFIKKGFEHNLENAVYWDRATDAVAFQSRAMTPPMNQAVKRSVANLKDKEPILYPVDNNDPAFRNRSIENSLIATQLSPGLVRVRGVKPNLPKIGWVLVAKGRNGYNRLAPAFRLIRSERLQVNNVTVHHASGMGLIAESCRDITLTRFNVRPDEADGRTIATTADATHFVGCRGEIKMEECTFENQFDDATNIHGTYFEVTDLDGKTAGLRVGHFQQTGYEFARPGDTVVAVNPRSSAKALTSLTVDSIRMINPRYFRIYFKETAEQLKKGFYLENISAYPTVEISNSRIVNNRARGFLISTPRRTIIQGNTFSNMMSAIQCPNEFTFWYESGFVRDLTIRNNTFLDGSYGPPKPLALINVMAHADQGEYIHGKIVIENNTFTTFASAILSAQNTQNIIFRNNVIRYSGKYPLNADNPVVKLQNVFRADITGNRYDAAFKNFIFTEPLPGKLIDQSNRQIGSASK